MPRAEVGTPKYLSNKMKSKGLQKLRWYCQMCQKQCRDDNGFKCHTQSESHQRQLLLFADNSKRYIDDFSREFDKSFTDTLRRRFGTKRVAANRVYQEYISDRNHLHMNATRWVTLTGYVKYLGRSGKCLVEENAEKNCWYITYIDRNPETLAAEERKRRKNKMDKDDDEKLNEFIEKQVKMGLEKQKIKDSSGNLENEPNILEPLKSEDLAQKLTLKIDKKLNHNLSSNVLEISSGTKRTMKKKKASGSKSDLSSLDEIMQKNEIEKEEKNRKDYWLTTGIVVKIVARSCEFLNSKAVIETVEDKYVAVVRILDESYENDEGMSSSDSEKESIDEIPLKNCFLEPQSLKNEWKQPAKRPEVFQSEQNEEKCLLWAKIKASQQEKVKEECQRYDRIKQKLKLMYDLNTGKQKFTSDDFKQTMNDGRLKPTMDKKDEQTIMLEGPEDLLMRKLEDKLDALKSKMQRKSEQGDSSNEPKLMERKEILSVSQSPKEDDGMVSFLESTSMANEDKVCSSGSQKADEEKSDLSEPCLMENKGDLSFLESKNEDIDSFSEPSSKKPKIETLESVEKLPDDVRSPNLGTIDNPEELRKPMMKKKAKKVRLDQKFLETVLPAIGKRVIVVNGAYRGNIATLKRLHVESYSADVEICAGFLSGRLIKKIDYNDICKLYE